MARDIQCPHCGQTYGLTDEQIPQYSSQTITCTQCHKPFTVPMLVASTAMPQPMPAQPISYATPAHYALQPNSMAVASLVCGILGFCTPLIGSVLGITFGILGLRRTRDPAVGGKGLAIAGITLGALSLLASTLMVATLLPSLSRARETANRVKCAANMKSIGQALMMYAGTNNANLPPGLPEMVLSTSISGDVFECPSNGTDSFPTGAPPTAVAQILARPGASPYVYTGAGFSTSTSAKTVLLYEAMTDHTNGGNFLFADGHVEYRIKAAAEKTIAALKAGQNPPP